MNQRVVVIALLVMLVAMLGISCSSALRPTPSPESIPAATTGHGTLLMIIERVQSLAQTYEAKEYVTLFFPPLSYHSEYDVELKAWLIELRTLPADARDRAESADWFNVDVEEYFSSFGEGW